MARYAFKRCNPGWEALESLEARSLRGRGWYTFARTVREERGNKCQVCGKSGLTREQKMLIPKRERHLGQLHVHHIIRVLEARHLRFERENVLVLCQFHHKQLEKLEPELQRRLAAIETHHSEPRQLCLLPKGV